MGTLAAGSVVLIPFPFSDLSKAKLRPAVVLAGVGRNDWILCQITSNPFADESAIRIADDCFEQGSLHRTSYARPGKLFTANHQIIAKEQGLLRRQTLRQIVETVIGILKHGLEPGSDP